MSLANYADPMVHSHRVDCCVRSLAAAMQRMPAQPPRGFCVQGHQPVKASLIYGRSDYLANRSNMRTLRRSCTFTAADRNLGTT